MLSNSVCFYFDINVQSIEFIGRLLSSLCKWPAKIVYTCKFVNLLEILYKLDPTVN